MHITRPALPAAVRSGIVAMVKATADGAPAAGRISTRPPPLGMRVRNRPYVTPLRRWPATAAHQNESGCALRWIMAHRHAEVRLCDDGAPVIARVWIA
ncbi:MAG: hypothetical protein ABSG53_08995 [Thermoguttaceae bacterium]